MNITTTNPDEPFDPRHNIKAKELDRDLINLNLPEADLIATEQECEAMYPYGVYQQMMDSISGSGERQKPADGA